MESNNSDLKAFVSYQDTKRHVFFDMVRDKGRFDPSVHLDHNLLSFVDTTPTRNLETGKMQFRILSLRPFLSLVDAHSASSDTNRIQFSTGRR